MKAIGFSPLFFSVQVVALLKENDSGWKKKSIQIIIMEKFRKYLKYSTHVSDK